MLVSSFPDDNHKSRGIFNYRLVKQLKELKQEVFVVFFRIWTPRRKLISVYSYDTIKVTQVCLPLVPIHNYYVRKLNIFVCRTFGWLLLNKQLKISNIIHSVYLTNNGLTAGYWARKLKIPHIAQAIGSDVNSDMKIFIKRNDTKWVKNIDGIIANSKNLEQSLAVLISNCPSVRTIYRGIALEEFKKNLYSKEPGITFLFLGGLELNKTLPFGINTKGGITLMKAWEKAENKLWGMKATLLFGGPNSDNKIFKDWKCKLKHPETVQLIGKIDPEEVNKYLLRSSISVIPSMEEGLPNFLMESAAHKRAAIGSTAGGIPEVIVPGLTGFIFEKGNINQLSDLLIQAAANGEIIEKMGEAAYDRVKADFNANNYSNNIISFYKKIMEKCAE